MLKNGYKILLIKEGKYDLKQFNVSFFHVVLIASLLFILSASLFFMFSEQLSNWAGSFEIEKHRRNNQILIQSDRITLDSKIEDIYLTSRNLGLLLVQLS